MTRNMPRLSIKKTFIYAGLVLVGIAIGANFGGSYLQEDTQPVGVPSPKVVEVSVVRSAPQEDGDSVVVARVIDGDTIELADARRVRYIGIDTPETVDPRAIARCFGKEAYERNKEMVLGKRVRMENDVSETDKYGRLLRYVYVGDVFVNRALVEDGYANASAYPPDVRYQHLFTAAERIAREQKRGLWGACPSASSPAATAPQQAPSFSAPPAQAAPGCAIKGNISSSGKIYHLPVCDSYGKTVINESQGERWFCAEGDALSAGWRKAKNCP